MHALDALQGTATLCSACLLHQPEQVLLLWDSIYVRCSVPAEALALKLDELKSGRGAVLESNHLLILGWSPKVWQDGFWQGLKMHLLPLALEKVCNKLSESIQS